MTIAICLNCGARRVGAITDCSECGVASTGLFELDVTFSDHRMSWENLEHFGAVIRAISDTGADDEIRRWAFLVHVSDTYPELLTVDPPADERWQALAVLENLSLPKVELELKSPGSRGATGSGSLIGYVAVSAIGSIIIAFGFSLETYELPWYRDVPSILVVGLGAMIFVGALQSIWEMAKENRAG